MEERVICPLIDDEIEPIDCMENQSIKPENIPQKFKIKENWKEICSKCKYQDY